MTTDRLPTLLLIHGAWQGSWAWNRLIPLLEARDFPVRALDLPGNGTDATLPSDVSLERYATHVGAALTATSPPVALIAHSGGGLVASQVAENWPDRIAGVVYIAGMMLPSGVAFGDLVRDLAPRHPEVVGVGPSLIWSDDRLTSTVPPEAAVRHFFHDCPPAVAWDAAGRLTPQPEGGRAVAATLSPARFEQVPKCYIEATDDRSVVPVLQRRMRELTPDHTHVTLPTGHAPHVSAPNLLVEAITPFLRGLSVRT